MDGLRTSIVDFNDNVEGSNTKDVMDLLLLTQVRQLFQEKMQEGYCLRDDASSHTFSFLSLCVCVFVFTVL